ncbi:MAG TPA: hypothetical protein VHE09_10460 [Rhizomicrobium sp.]|jgi:hypothetical protein|nr:hypothetical protein [Rhizomicrobium sp.]
MAQEVHYEIFTRQGSKGGWKMLDVRSDREVAIEFAKSLMADERATGVKVVKETYNNETGDYLTLKIFEDGHNTFKSTPAQEDAPHALPCFKPDDLYSYHARATISRLLGDYLARNKLTLTELSHRADALERLEATGTILQHAIQKIAVAQAASTTTPVQQIVKSLNELVNAAFQRVYRDKQKGYFPNPALAEFNRLAATLCKQPDGAYVLNGAIANHLRDAKGWDEKVMRLLALTEQADGEGRTLLLASIDAIIAEILSGAAALRDLIGAQESFGDEMASLVELFLGVEPKQDGARKGLIALTHHFAADDLPEARTAIAQRLMAEFRSIKRLRPASLIEEFQTLRRIADRLVRGLGKYLSHEDLIAAFTLRSKRLVTNETLNEHLAEAVAPDEKLNLLLAVEENIIGAENKRRLAEFLIPILTALSFETHFQNMKLPILARLQALAALQARVLRSGFQDNQKDEIAALLDKTANEAEQRAKLFDSLLANVAGPVERARKLLKLCTDGYVTEGQLATRARGLVIAQLSQPGFLTGYTAQCKRAGEPPNAEIAMAELVGTLGKAGISAETGLKSIAA